jgi:TRAP-type uncharacterized transport system fused permease subunit
MNDREPKELGEKLRDAIPSLRQPELSRDLWPAMLAKLDEPRVRVPWFDWLLAAIAAAVLIFFPGAIPALLYHL